MDLKMFRQVVLLVVLLLCTASGGQLLASSTEVKDRLYNEGVHAYFTGDYALCAAKMEKVIGPKLINPLPLYFRGLAQLQLKKTDKAGADFARAAKLEMAPTNKFYDVSRALLRVQGKSRAIVEQARQKARKLAKSECKKATSQFFEATRCEEGRVLRKNLDLKPARF
jgi:TfoX/Sxy family transcriptional regulator of competence genes